FQLVAPPVKGQGNTDKRKSNDAYHDTEEFLCRHFSLLAFSFCLLLSSLSRSSSCRRFLLGISRSGETDGHRGAVRVRSVAADWRDTDDVGRFEQLRFNQVLLQHGYQIGVGRTNA